MKDKILYECPTFEDDFRDLISDDELRYFYHVTDQDGDNINEKGLYLKEKRLSSTTIEIPNEFKLDPINYCLNEKGSFYRKNPNIVLFGIPTDEVKYAIENNPDLNSKWQEDENLEYIIPNRYIIGYINTTDFSINENPDYEYNYKLY